MGKTGEKGKKIKTLAVLAACFTAYSASGLLLCPFDGLVDSPKTTITAKTAKRRVDRLDERVRALAQAIGEIEMERFIKELAGGAKAVESAGGKEEVLLEQLKGELEKLDKAVLDEMAVLRGVRLLELGEAAKTLDRQEYFPSLMGGFTYRPSLQPLSSEMKKKRLLTIDNRGRFIQGGKAFTSGRIFGSEFSAGTTNYVMLENGEIVTGFEHHSQLAGGLRVVCAGSILVEKGVLKQITEDSGHYLPSPSYLLRVLHVLRYRGLDLSVAQLSVRHRMMGLPQSFREAPH